MLATFASGYQRIIPTVADGTRPGAIGTAVTPKQNDIATAVYTELIDGALVDCDIWEIMLCVSAVQTAGAGRDLIVTLGYDPAAGTSYVDTDQNLLVGPAGLYVGAASNGGPVWFRLPRRIKAGTSIAIKGSVNSATLTAFNVAAYLFGKPRRPEMCYSGSYVDTLGADTANSRGTIITPGAASEGAYTEIGTLTRPCRYIEWGYGMDDAATANNVGHVDIAIGDATNKRIVVQDGYIFSAANEALGKHPQGAYVDGAVGDKFYARAQWGPNAVDANNSVSIYAVGG